MSAPPNSKDHERFEDDAVAYALGTLEDQKVRPFEEHLAECPRCCRDLQALGGAVDALPALAPEISPPAELKQRVMAEVRAEAGPRPGAAAARAERTWRGGRLIWHWPRPAIGGAAAAMVALVVVIAVLSLGGARSGRTYAGIAYAPGASASVRVSGGRARLVFARLPALPARLIYQVWIERGTRSPVAAGVLFASTTGAIAIPGGTQRVHSVLVTAEPRPHGSQRPTRKPIIVVHLA